MPLNPEQIARLHARFPTLQLHPGCSIVDSWFGLGVSLGDNAGVHLCKVDARVRIGAGSHIVASEIGAGASIGENCIIGSAPEMAVTRIGRDVQIGDHAQALPGVRIGDGAIVPAGAIIKTDLPGDRRPRASASGNDPDDVLPLREFLLEKLPLANIFRKWSAANGDATLRVDYPLTVGSRVLDVGGYQGDWTHEILHRYGSRIDVYEPVGAFAAGIRKRFQNDPRVAVHDFGLSRRTRTQEISLACESSSVLRRASSATESIRLVAAKEILEAIEGDIALMKINIEGCEYDLLEHLLDEGLIGRVRYLQIQFHDFVPDARPRRRAIRGRLKQTHCEQWNYPFIWEGWAPKA